MNNSPPSSPVTMLDNTSTNTRMSPDKSLDDHKKLEASSNSSNSTPSTTKKKPKKKKKKLSSTPSSISKSCFDLGSVLLQDKNDKKEDLSFNQESKSRNNGEKINKSSKVSLDGGKQHNKKETKKAKSTDKKKLKKQSLSKSEHDRNHKNSSSRQRKQQLLISSKKRQSKSCSRLNTTIIPDLSADKDNDDRRGHIHWLLNEEDSENIGHHTNTSPTQKQKVHSKTKKKKNRKADSSACNGCEKSLNKVSKSTIKKKSSARKQGFMSKSCSNLELETSSSEDDEKTCQKPSHSNEPRKKKTESDTTSRRTLLKKSRSVCTRSEMDKSKSSVKSRKSKKKSKRKLEKSTKNGNRDSSELGSSGSDSTKVEVDDDEDSITACIRLYLAIHQDDEEEKNDSVQKQQELAKPTDSKEASIAAEKMVDNTSEDDETIDKNGKLIKTTKKSKIRLSEKNDGKAKDISNESDGRSSPRCQTSFDRTNHHLFLSPCLDTAEIAARPGRLRGLSPGVNDALGQSCPNLFVAEEVTMGNITNTMSVQGIEKSPNMSLKNFYPTFLSSKYEDGNSQHIAYSSERSTRFRGLSPGVFGQENARDDLRQGNSRVAKLRLAFQKEKCLDIGRSCPNLMRQNSVSKLRSMFDK